MRFLGRKARSTEAPRAEDAPRIVTREIEITVEREWISMTAVPQPRAGMPATETKSDPLAELE
jgi:hypothetical protein